MVSVRKDHASLPASVEESWRRIEAWLGEHLPILKLSLRPGISKRDLAKFEKAIGRPLPADVRESWLIHDGQRPIPYLMEDPAFNVEDYDDLLGKGVVFGSEILPLLDKKDCLASEPSLGHWKFWAGMVGASERGEDDGMLDEFSRESTSLPDGAIQRLHACLGWIPLVEMNDSNHVGIDLDPGPDGVVGQVINFGRDQEQKYVLARSWAHFLKDVADELEAGNFVLTNDEGSKTFGLKEPHRGELWLNIEEWSEAKLDPDIGGRE
ncbi:MAG: SMI1/KNR4 family protein [Isosphaeraceae bacterium]